MRILQFKTSAGHGGAETLILAFTKSAGSKGHELLTVFGEQGWLVEQFRANGLSSRVISLLKPWDLLSLREVWLQLRSFEPDVVLSHGARVNLFASTLASIAGVPSVSVEHNVDDWRHGAVLNSVDRAVARLNFGRIAVSGAVREMLIERRIVPEERVHLVPNAVELREVSDALSDQALRKRFKIPRQAIVVVVVARLVPQKGHRHLIDAVKILRATVPEAFFLLLGDGGLRGELEREVVRLGLSPKFGFAGAVDDVRAILPACDLFVLPSLWEGMPVALIEAMAAGLPCIATKVAGVPEVIEDGVSGALVPPGDSVALASRIEELLVSPEKRSQLGRAAKVRAMRHFDISRLVDQYIGVLQSAVGPPREQDVGS